MASIFPSLVAAPFSLSDALDAVDRGQEPAARLQAAVDALHAMGFQRVVATLRDASFTATMVVVAGQAGVHGPEPLPGAVWRRRIVAIERFRQDELYLLDGTDAWVAREFFGSGPSAVSDDPDEWVSCDLLLGLLRGPDGEVIGIVKMAAPRDGRRPDEARRRDIGWLLRHTASRVSHDVLRALARRRAERLQRLQEAGAALARSLDEQEIVRELARQAMRASGADGAMLAIPNLDEDTLVTAYRIYRGAERPRDPMPLGNGVIAHVARTGRAFRIGDREADRAHQREEQTYELPSTSDVADDKVQCTSILAVPLLVGIRLVGVLVVYAGAREVFTAEDEEVLATIASQAATAIANARRYAESERERRQIEALADVARAVGASLRLGEVLRLILRHSIALLGAEGACIALRSDDYMHIVAGVGAADVLAGVHLPVHSSLLGRTVLTGELKISNSFDTDPSGSRTVLRLAEIRRTVIAPLVTARGTIGAIAVINRSNEFTDEDARVLKRLSDQVAVAIVNARLFEEVELATREWKVAFDAIANGMVVLDDEGLVRRCNARAAELSGMSQVTDLLNQRFSTVLLGESNCAELDTLLATRPEEGMPLRATVRNDVRGRLYDVTVSPHPDGGSVLTFDDVTQVHGLAERHRRVLETASDAIIITDMNRRVAYANPAAQTLFMRNDLVGARTGDLIPPEAHDVLMRAESAAMSGAEQRYDLPVLRADGELRMASISSAPLVEVGQITGTVACLRDVTDQRADAAALQRSEARYTRLVEAASDAIFTVDINGCFTSANRSLEEATGKTRDVLIGVPCRVIVDPRDRLLADDTLRATFRGERQKVQLRFLDANGKVRVGALLAAPIMDGDAVVGGLAVVRDITDEELQREAMAQQQHLASMGRVLGGIANELNNPLSSLLAVAELEASSQTLEGSDRDAIQQILSEARRASRIVRHLLGVSRDRGSQRSSVRLNALVKETLDLHGYALREINAHVRTDLCVQDPAVAGNSAQVQQVLLNLLRNAEEALSGWNGRREIVVRTFVREDRAIVEVSDTGPGIREDHVARVFEPLFTTQQDSQMRGLGLAVAHAVVSDHGGRISASSSPNSGATITLEFPLVMSAALRRELSSPTGQHTVLIVEDESTLRQAMNRFLSKHGYAVTAVDNGAQALDAIKNAFFDVVLLDLRMFGMSGDEVYKRIAALAPAQAERVIFVTGDLHNPHVSEFIESTGRKSVAKPFQLSELMEHVEKIALNA